MRALRIGVSLVIISGGLALLAAPGAVADQEQPGHEQPEGDGRRARDRVVALRERLRELESDKARLESRIDAARRALERAEARARNAPPPDTRLLPPHERRVPPEPRQMPRGLIPMPNPIPPPALRDPPAPRLAPELREGPRVIPPAESRQAVPEGVPEHWVPREYNGIRYYVVPLGRSD